MQKILLSNVAHLGDVIIATAVLPALKNAFPHAQIGFVVGSWAQEVVADHPLIDCVYTIDHWKHSRQPISLWKKVYRHFKSAWKTARALKKERYEVCINLYCYTRNCAFFYWLLRIPRRIGYYRRDFLKPFFSDPLPWQDQKKHMSFYYEALLKKLSLTEKQIAHMKPTLSPLSLLQEKKGIICHMGAGDPIKQWKEENWRELCRKLKEDGHLIIFTGKGEEEEKKAEKLSAYGLNLCNKLSWKELMQQLAQTTLLIAVDTAIGHAAAALEIPTLSLFGKGSDPCPWAPLNPKGIVLQDPTVEEVYINVLSFTRK